MRRMPPWYVWLMLVLGTVLSNGATWVITLHSAQRAVNAERAARLESDAARRNAAQASLTVLCDVITKQEAVFLESNTSVGRNAARAWHDLGITYRCY